MNYAKGCEKIWKDFVIPSLIKNAELTASLNHWDQFNKDMVQERDARIAELENRNEALLISANAYAKVNEDNRKYDKAFTEAYSKMESEITRLKSESVDEILKRDKVINQHHTKISELEKERDQSWPAKDTEIEVLESEIDRLKKCELDKAKELLDESIGF